MMTPEIAPEKRPHWVTGAFNQYAFNALAVMGLIAAFHGGLKRIWIIPGELAFVLDSSPAKELQAQGWTFYEMKN
jgi:hypothetical protein